MRFLLCVSFLFLLFCNSLFISAQEPPILTPQAPLVTCNQGCATPEPHRVKASLTTCCGGVTDEMLVACGAQWLYGWYPTCGMEGDIPYYPMIRDLNHLDLVRSGSIDLSDCNRPILSFNEPASQVWPSVGGMTLTEVITGHHEIELLFPNHEIVSPGFIMPWMGLEFGLLDWIDASTVYYGVKPRFEYAALHEYGSTSLGTTWAESFAVTSAEYDAIKAGLIARGYDVPIFITELGWWEGPGPWCEDWGICPNRENAKAFLQAWINKCNNDNTCQFLNWFSLTKGDYEVVNPLYFGSTLTPAGEVWVKQFGQL